MKRVLLIGQTVPDNEARPGVLVLPPLGLHRLAAALRTTDCEVEVYDPCIDGLPEPVIYDGWDYIGFSPLSDTLAGDLEQMNLAHAVNPQAEIIVGGVEASANYQTVFDYAPVTWVVLGYGEQAILMITAGRPANEIDGVVYRRHAKHITADELYASYCAVDFGHIGYERYWDRLLEQHRDPSYLSPRTVRLVTSTHCNVGCTFCAVTNWYTGAVGRRMPPSVMSADQVLSLVGQVKAEIPTVESIYLCDDDFCCSKDRVIRFAKRSAEFGVTYLIQSHMNRLDEDLVNRLAAGGVTHISIGVENASERVLQTLNKPQKLDKVPQIIEWCVNAGIVPYLFLILFAPSVTVADILLNCRKMREWSAMGAKLSANASMNVYRGAALHDSTHDFLWKSTPIAGTPKSLKHAEYVLPDDSDARELLIAFEGRWPEYRDAIVGESPLKVDMALPKADLLEEIAREKGFA